MSEPSEAIALDRFRSHIERALSYSGDTHQFEDVAAMVSAGRAQFWPGPDSVLITETVEYPRKRFLNVFLAAGNLPELEAMIPLVLDWGKTQGCTHASFIGRRGWERTFVARMGWEPADMILMQKVL